jgi:hypothetical protein
MPLHLFRPEDLTPQRCAGARRRSPLGLLLAATLVFGCASGGSRAGDLSGGSGGEETGGESGGTGGKGGSQGPRGQTGGSSGDTGGAGGSVPTGGSGGAATDASMEQPDAGGTGSPDAGPTMPPPPLPADDQLPPCLRTVKAGSSAELSSALGAAKPGDCIELADGDYAFPAIAAKGTEKAPIVVKASNLLEATVSTGRLDFNGAEWVVVQGLTYKSSGTIKMNNCQYCRLSRSRLELAETLGGGDNDWITVSGTSNHCRIDHNDMGPKIQIGNTIMLSGAGPQIVQNTRIDHNHFHDIKHTTGNGWETIRAGLSSWWLSIAHSVIELNLFERADGDPETISIKSSQNVIRWNTMRGTNGQFVLRHGNGSEMYGNFIFGDGLAGAGGIRVHGGNHKIYNNYIEGTAKTGINLEGGEFDDNSGAPTDHKQVYSTQVMFNTLIGRPLVVGGAHPLDPHDCTFANNVVIGSTITQTATSMNNRFAGNIVTGTGGVTTGVKNLDLKVMKVGDLTMPIAGGPVVDAADPLLSVMTDISGLARTKPDVGAFELANWSGAQPIEGAINRPLTAKDVGPLSP